MNSTKNGDLKKSLKKNYTSNMVKNIYRKFWKKKRFSNHTANKEGNQIYVIKAK